MRDPGVWIERFASTLSVVRLDHQMHKGEP